MRRIIWTLFFGISVLISLSSCHKCESHYLGYLSFTQTDLKIVPYAGNEQLVFRDSLGDSIIFNGSVRGALAGNNGIKYSESPPRDPGDCPGDYFYTEYNYTTFYNNDSSGRIELDLWMSSPFEPGINKRIRISIYDLNETGGFSADFYFDSLKLYEIPGWEEGYFLFADSILSGSKMYYSVYQLFQNYEPDGKEYIRYIYYTPTDGIIGFKTYFGKNWHL